MFKKILKIKEKYFPGKKFRRSRIWSNEELKKIAPLCTGDIINVSGWLDEDKRGLKYSSYFKNKKSYTISNYPGGHAGFQNRPGELIIDLEEDLPEIFKEKYDVVFNHTVLGHIYDVRKAFKNLCLMTRDLVIIIVPWMQELHYNEGYKDYWRISPYALEKMFTENSLKLVHLSANNRKKQSIYILAVGSKYPERWKEKMKIDQNIFDNLGEKIIN